MYIYQKISNHSNTTLPFIRYIEYYKTKKAGNNNEKIIYYTSSQCCQYFFELTSSNLFQLKFFSREEI